MKRILLLIALMTSVGSVVIADELDRDVVNTRAALSKDLPATVVVRVNEKDHSVGVLHSKEALTADASTAAALVNARFEKPQAEPPKVDELDRYTSKDSWYFYYNYYNYMPTYYYYGYNYCYQPYYSYYNSGYYYYYYHYRWSW